MGTIFQRGVRYGVIGLYLGSIGLLYQNCSGGFQVQQTSSSLVSGSSVQSTPDIVFMNAQDTYNTSNIGISFSLSSGSSSQAKSITCQLNSNPPLDCSSMNINYTNLADGDYSLTVALVTLSGGSKEARRLFRKDSTAPTISVSSMPAAISNQVTAQFIFSASDNLSGVASIECSLDNAAFAICTSPVTLNALTVGSHNYRIRAIDRALNTSLVYSYNWTIDTSAPTVIISSMPAAVTNSTSASFSFSGASIVSFECQVDAGAYAACTSPQAYTGLSSGSHTFRVRGTSGTGSVSSPAVFTWNIDNVAPTLPVLMANITSPTALRTASITFSSTDAGSGISSYQCSLDNAAFAVCTSPRSLTAIADGSHTLRVRAFDAAGNQSPDASFTWVVDATNPVLAFSQTPSSATTATSATFAFTATDANLNTVQCSLDNVAFATCTSPVNLSNLSVAAHGFRVQATDRVGNSAMISYNWTVTSGSITPSPLPSSGGLVIDLSYVDKTSAQYTRFKSMVDAALAGNPDYGFEPQHAAYMFRLTGETKYCDYAINFAENCPSRYADPGCGVVANEAAIASGTRPSVSGDSYLEVGPVIGSLAITYDWCAARMTASQRTRWSNFANQAISNVWNPNGATWGGRSFPWSGWSIDNPGNNYYYSFLEATMYWALASRDQTMLNMVRNDKLKALTDYYGAIPGGGSREGTGYGAAHMRLFQIYQVWKDSTGEDLANINSHLTDSIRFWTHATTPNRAYYAPAGDLARSSFPDIFDYHRRIILEARRLTNSAVAQDLASWWLNHISVTEMGRRIDSQWDLLPAGSNVSATPNEPLSYRATGVGRIFARTGWDTNAMWMSFNAGPYVESHAHQDQGSFTLANNLWLAVTNNIYSSSGIEQSTDFHNIIRFVQNGTIVPQREGTTSLMTVNQLDAAGNVDVTGNLTPAYGGSSAVQNWTRNVRFAARKLTVTDSFTVGAGTTGIFQIQVPVQPVISGSTITAGGLHIRVLSPANPTITVVNQQRFRIDISGGTSGYVVELTDQ